MIFCRCPNCGVELEIYENDCVPGCRDDEEVYCPKCKCLVTKVFTSGFPDVKIREDSDEKIKGDANKSIYE